jgi:hypothetical protein
MWAKPSDLAAVPLDIRVSNEYGMLSTHTRDAYGYFDHVVEPSKTTIISVNAAIAGRTYTWTLSSIGAGGAKTELLTATGEAFSYVFGAETNKWFSLVVVETSPDGTTRTLATDNIVSKYVRREIRNMTASDRSKVFDAMSTMYGLSLDEGQKLYGPNFKSAGYFAALHSTQLYCYHGGEMFLTAHPAFQLWFEDSLRAVDPTISTTFYWDYELDTALYGPTWFSESPVYKDDWFGSVMGDAATEYKVTTGRFANQRVSTHGPDDPFSIGTYNSFGSIGAGCDNTASAVIQRSVNFCGLQTQQTFAPVKTMVDCMMTNKELLSVDLCLEQNVHGNLHR